MKQLCPCGEPAQVHTECDEWFCHDCYEDLLDFLDNIENLIDDRKENLN